MAGDAPYSSVMGLQSIKSYIRNFFTSLSTAICCLKTVLRTHDTCIVFLFTRLNSRIYNTKGRPWVQIPIGSLSSGYYLDGWLYTDR